MQCRSLLVGVALDLGVNIVWQVVVLLEQPQRFVEKLSKPLFALSISEIGDRGCVELALVYLVEACSLCSILLGRPARGIKAIAERHLPGSKTFLLMPVTGFEKFARREADARFKC